MLITINNKVNKLQKNMDKVLKAVEEETKIESFNKGWTMANEYQQEAKGWTMADKGEENE